MWVRSLEYQITFYDYCFSEWGQITKAKILGLKENSLFTKKKSIN